MILPLNQSMSLSLNARRDLILIHQHAKEHADLYGAGGAISETDKDIRNR
jgi:hypothetical protein